MIGACSILRKKAEHDDEQFYSHWLNVHGPLAAELHGVRRYLQSHFRNDSPLTNDKARQLSVNGLAEIWFDSEADREICYDSEQEEICDVDSLLFIGATARFVSDVHVHVAPTGKPAPFKHVCFFLGEGRGVEFSKIMDLPGICGLVDHMVTKPGAEPTQERDRVDVQVSRIVSVACEDEASLAAARAIITDHDRANDIAVFDCQEHYIV